MRIGANPVINIFLSQIPKKNLTAISQCSVQFSLRTIRSNSPSVFVVPRTTMFLARSANFGSCAIHSRRASSKYNPNFRLGFKDSVPAMVTSQLLNHSASGQMFSLEKINGGLFTAHRMLSASRSLFIYSRVSKRFMMGLKGRFFKQTEEKK